MKQKIAIIGSGNVGGALKRGLEKAGYEVHNSQRETARETAEWGELVILAVPFTVLDDVVRELGDSINGKTVVDVTNALTQEMQLALGFSTSGAEETAKESAWGPCRQGLQYRFCPAYGQGQRAGPAIDHLCGKR